MSKPRDFWKERKTTINTHRPQDFRTEYEKDYSRIIHSAAFRRLQRKTQVLGLGDGDFYRTRLTHTIEVSQIAYGICCHFSRKDPQGPYVEYVPEHALISSICATHDIGHPPFGHGGEIALNFMMREHGGFEGNAHTLNILTNFEERENNCGLNLTKRMLLGIIKYPNFYETLVKKSQNEQIKRNKNAIFREVKRNDWKPPKCIFDKDEQIIKWIMNKIDETEIKKFMSYIEDENNNQHKKTIYKSFDCSIMEIADDISYGAHDLEDAIHLGLLSKDQFMRWFEKSNINTGTDWAKQNKIGEIPSGLFSDDGSKRKETIGGIINTLISSSYIYKMNEFSDNVIDLKAEINDDAKLLLKILKDVTVNEVIRKPEVQTLEYRGQIMLMDIFQSISSDPERFLSGRPLARLQEADDQNKRMRVICDYIAGMTDDYATKIYQRFFVPGTISVFQKL